MYALIIFSQAVLPLAYEEPLIEVVKREAVPAWKRLARHETTGNGRIVYTKPNNPRGPSSVSFGIADGLISARLSMRGAWWEPSLTTPVARHAGVGPGETPKKPEPVPRWAEQELFGVLTAPYCIYAVPLFELLDDPDFTVTAAERVVHEGAPRVKLTFKSTGDHTNPYRFYTDG